MGFRGNPVEMLVAPVKKPVLPIVDTLMVVDKIRNGAFQKSIFLITQHAVDEGFAFDRQGAQGLFKQFKTVEHNSLIGFARDQS